MAHSVPELTEPILFSFFLSQFSVLFSFLDFIVVVIVYMQILYYTDVS